MVLGDELFDAGAAKGDDRELGGNKERVRQNEQKDRGKLEECLHESPITSLARSTRPSARRAYSISESSGSGAGEESKGRSKRQSGGRWFPINRPQRRLDFRVAFEVNLDLDQVGNQKATRFEWSVPDQTKVLAIEG